MTPLHGEHALVSGANRGIGAAIARHLAAAGADVSLLVRDPHSAAALAEELRGRGVRVGVVAADVTHREAVREACATAAAERGPVTVLVNNAGSVTTAPFLKSDPSLFDAMLAVHLLGPVHTTQAVLPAMIERGRGAIVNVASIAGLRGAAYITAYVAAKHALVGLTRALAAEFQAKGIRVNAVCPGYAATDMVADGVARIVAKTGRSDAEALRSMLANEGQARLVRPEEIAAAVIALCDPASTASGEALVLMGEDDA